MAMVRPVRVVMSDGVVRLHGAGQHETMLFEGRATVRLTRQGGREPAVGGYLSRRVVGQELPSSTGHRGWMALWQRRWWKQAKVSVER
jgi:hypothetical protein